MSVRINMSGLKSYVDKMSRLNNTQAEQFTVENIRNTAARLLSKVIRRTPVGQYPKGSGKVGGTLRIGWSIGDIIKNGTTYSIEIINPIKYASYVEYGHRRVPGKSFQLPDGSWRKTTPGWTEGIFMLTISENEIEKDTPGILEKELDAFVRSVVL